MRRHGRERPVPPSASSTKPYFANVRRWNEQLAGDSPTSSAASVAVSGPSRVSASSSAHRTGWASARISRASVTGRGSGLAATLVERPPAAPFDRGLTMRSEPRGRRPA